MNPYKRNNWIDITHTLQNGMVHWPTDPAFNIEFVKDMEKGDRNNVSYINTGSHVGTHMDAPLHFLKNGKSLDKAPLDVLIGPSRIIEIKNKGLITKEELKNNKIKRGERLIFKTKSSSSRWINNKFKTEFVHFSEDAAEYISSFNPKLIGIDYLSVGSFKDGSKVHNTLLGKGIWILEGLNLYKIKPGKYDLICLPMKILNSDGAPARVAIKPR